MNDKENSLVNFLLFLSKQKKDIKSIVSPSLNKNLSKDWPEEFNEMFKLRLLEEEKGKKELTKMDLEISKLLDKTRAPFIGNPLKKDWIAQNLGKMEYLDLGLGIRPPKIQTRQPILFKTKTTIPQSTKGTVKNPLKNNALSLSLDETSSTWYQTGFRKDLLKTFTTRCSTGSPKKPEFKMNSTFRNHRKLDPLITSPSFDSIGLTSMIPAKKKIDFRSEECTLIEKGRDPNQLVFSRRIKIFG